MGDLPPVRRALGGLVFLCLLLPMGARADPGTTPGGGMLEEAFVELRVTKTRGSPFYRVMVDRAETPYVEVREGLARWLDMAAECEPERRYCQAVMQPAGRLYWIDGNNGELGDADTGARPFPKDALRLREGRLWLRYDVWERWLPLNAGWSVWSYTLALRPRFALLEDLKRRREETRRLQRETNARTARLAALPEATPPSAPRAEGRYRIEAGRLPGQDPGADLDVELAADVLEGTALVGGHRHLEPGESTGRVDFWRYRKTRHRLFHQLELGDTRLDAGTLLSAINVRTGVRVDRRERVRGAGIFEFRDRTQPGTEIDVYRNGFLENTLVAGADGLYEIEEQLVSGGDQVTLHLYFPDGAEQTRIIRIARDHALILPKGEWDARFLAGESEDGGLAHASVRYGFARAFSAGLHAYRLPDPLREAVGGAALDLAWRPLFGLTLLSEGLRTDAGLDWEVSADITGIPLNTFQLELRRLAPTSPVAELPGQQDTDREMWRVRHIFRLSRWGWQAGYAETDRLRRLETDADLRLTRRVALRARTDHTWDDASGDQAQVQGGVVFTFTPATLLELDRRQGTESDQWSGAFRLQGGRTSPWDANLSVTKDDGEGADTVAGLTWRATRRLWLSVFADPEGWGAQLTWSDVVAPRPGARYWDEFGTGTLSGRVMMPPEPEREAQPLAGVRVRADVHSAVTDREGRYLLTGLPPDRRIVVTVDPNSLDASLRPAREAAVVRFRPGTHVRYDPELSWTAGLDAVLLRPGGVPAGAAVEVVRMADGVVAATAPVEPDGFFLIEGLVPGRYRLTLTGVTEPPEQLEVTLPAGVDWVSGVEWPWPTPRDEENPR